MAKKRTKRRSSKSSSRKSTSRKRTRRAPRSSASGVCNKGFVLTDINPKTGKRYKRRVCLMWRSERAKVRTHTPRKPNLIESPFPKAVNGLSGRRRRRRR